MDALAAKEKSGKYVHMTEKGKHHSTKTWKRSKYSVPSLPWSTVEISGKIWHKNELPLPKGDQFREHLNRLVIHPVFKDEKKDNQGNTDGKAWSK